MNTIFLQGYGAIVALRRNAHARVLVPVSGKCDKFGEILTPRVFDPIWENDYTLGGKRFHRTLIMCHKDDGTAECPQCRQDLFPAGRVKVVGWLVEQQDV